MCGLDRKIAKILSRHWRVGLPTLVSTAVLLATPSLASAAVWRSGTAPILSGDDVGALVAVTHVAGTDRWWAVGFGSGPLIETTTGTRSDWQVMGYTPNGTGALRGVAAASAARAWAVGDQIEQWDGTSWQVVTTPLPTGAIGSTFNAVAAVSKSNVWAVGSSWTVAPGAAQTLIEHGNGKAWSVVSNPDPPLAWTASLTAISAVPGTAQLWAFGTWETDTSIDEHPWIEHYVSGKWRTVTPPAAAPVVGLSSSVAISSRNVWAVGDTVPTCDNGTIGPSQTLALHWNGRRWSVVPALNMFANGCNVLYGVSVIPGTTQLWAVGSAYDVADPSTGNVLIERYRNGAWTIVPSGVAPTPQPLGLVGVYATSRTNAWAVGSEPGPHAFLPLVDHYR